MTPKHKALEKKKGSRVSKKQLHRESIGHLEHMASKESSERKPFTDKYGSFEDRFEKFIKNKK